MTAASSITSAYLACRSNKLLSCTFWCRSPTASFTTMGTKPCWQASVAVARTHPDVETPVMRSVSTPAAVSVEASEVPKKALAYCFVTTSSVSRGVSCGGKAPRGDPRSKMRSRGILR